jgi:hypothetical protein
MTDDVPQTTEPPPPEPTPLVAQVSSEDFAATFLAKGFRLRETAAKLQMPVVEAMRLLADHPDTAAHIERLVTTGNMAIRPAGPREIGETLTRGMRFEENEFHEPCKECGCRGRDAIAALRMKGDMAMNLYKIMQGPPKRIRNKLGRPRSAEIVEAVVEAEFKVEK